MKKTQSYETDKMQILRKQRVRKQNLTKPLAITMALSLLLSGTACGNKEDASLSGASNQAMGANASAAEAENRHVANEQDKPENQSGQQSPNGLKLLCTEDGSASCATQEGYYYISTELLTLQDKSLGTRLMYMDYASCREICLCSAPGCTHDTKDCTAVLPNKEFPAYTSKLFLHQGSLYILSRQPDFEGSYSSSFSPNGESFVGETSKANDLQAVLYRMNPDGTGRQKVYSFDPNLTLEGTLALDEQGLYAITKKLSSQKEGNGEYTSATEKTLVYLDLSSYSLTQISDMEFGDNISWDLIGCADGSFLLKGIDYGRKLTTEEYYDDDAYPEFYKNSHTVFALLDTASGSPKEFYRIGNEGIHSAALLGNNLYISFIDNGQIISVNVATGEERLLVTHPQNYITGTIGNMLCCQNLNSSADPSYYFIDTDTGEIRHSDLVNKTLGWSLDLVAETESDVLVIYDYDATATAGGGYEIHLYQYGLISKEDLFSGKENYRKIQMTGRGR